MGDGWPGGAKATLEFPYQPRAELLRPGEVRMGSTGSTDSLGSSTGSAGGRQWKVRVRGKRNRQGAGCTRQVCLLLLIPFLPLAPTLQCLQAAKLLMFSERRTHTTPVCLPETAAAAHLPSLHCMQAAELSVLSRCGLYCCSSSPSPFSPLHAGSGALGAQQGRCVCDL